MTLTFGYAFFFCLCGDDAFFRPETPDGLLEFLCRVALISVAAGTVFLSGKGLRLRSTRESEGKREMSPVEWPVRLLSSLAPLAASAVLAAGGSPTLVVSLWALGGVSVGFCQQAGSVPLCEAGPGGSLSFMAKAVFLSAMLFLVVVVVPPELSGVVATAYALAALVSDLVLRKNVPEDYTLVDEDAMKNAREARESVSFTLIACIGQGMGLQMVASAAPDVGYLTCAIAVGVAWLLANLVIVVDQPFRIAVDEDHAMRYLYPIIVGPLVMALSLDPTALLVGGMVMVFLTWIVLVIGCSAEADTVNNGKLFAAYALNRGWYTSFAGYAIGFAVAYVLTSSSVASTLVYGMFVGCVAVVLLLASSHDRRVFFVLPWQDEPNGSEAPSGLTTVHPKKPTEDRAEPLRQVGGNGSQDDPLHRPFRAKCNRIATEYRLSPRQREVFLLLIHGRDRKFIQDELVLSRGTVDTHTYNIYRKLDVHSRQELIDFVDTYEAGKKE